jgi:protein-S-isoprenylcysteine O-methyltransferase Ste14
MGAIVRRVNAPVVEARKTWLHPETRRFDKVPGAVFLYLEYLQPVIAGLDVVRFRCSSMPFGLVYPGGLLFLVSLASIGWSLAVKRFAENSVRTQTDRGHIAITTGPYRFVRHPMCVCTILMYVATALVLGSVWALPTAGVIAALFIWGTAWNTGRFAPHSPVMPNKPPGRGAGSSRDCGDLGGFDAEPPVSARASERAW